MTSHVHICRGPETKEVFRGHDERKWCFGCRRHLVHQWVVRAPVEPSYYGPSGMWECPECKQDSTHFPGTFDGYEEP